MTLSKHTKLLFIDIETYSSEDLTSCGVYRYAEADDFEIMLLGYAYDNDSVHVLDLAQGDSIPSEVLHDLTDANVLKIAHNANFERVCLTRYLGKRMVPEQWYCTMVRAMSLGLPKSLENVGEALGLSDKDKKDLIGKRLIQYFAKPCAPTRSNGGRIRNLPKHDLEKWEIYKNYNKQDVVTERVIFNTLSQYPEISDQEHQVWCVDQDINDAGVEIDTKLVEEVLYFSEANSKKLLEEAKAITGLENPQSMIQAKSWLAERNVPTDTLTKEDVKTLINKVDDKTVLRFLEIRQELGKTSLKKYDAIQRSLCSDNKCRGMFQFYGAGRTGRWSGKIVQLQNLPQNHIEELDQVRTLVKEGDFETLDLIYPSINNVLSELIRTAFIAGKNKTFCVCDYSAIEARVIAWLAGEQWRLDAFINGKDIYCESASQMFGVPVVKHGVNGELRAKGKVAELACGYQGGLGAIKAMGGDKMGLSDAEMKKIVNNWRAKSPKIVALWNRTNEAAIEAVLHPGIIQEVTKGIYFQMKGKHLFAYLPSGRPICYNSAQLIDKGGYQAVAYMGTNQVTNKWELIDTYGGKLVENLTQATARDCLAESMLKLKAKGLLPAFHIHDELVIPVPKDTASDNIELIKKTMALQDVEWTKGLPLKAEGYITEYYLKD